jgi:glycosyltransferase involved in cell wall biosynthesis
MQNKIMKGKQMNDPIEISVVVPAYNCKRTLKPVILNLIDQSRLPDGMEIIVIDDGSTDGTCDWLEQQSSKHPSLIKCFFQENRGASASRNFGIENATGRVILFLDADIIPSSGLIQKHIMFHRKHPQAYIALRGKTVEIKRSRNNEWIRPHPGTFKTRGATKNDLPWIEFITNNVSLKSQFLKDNRLLFNEILFPGEDVEFGFRAKQCGLVIYFSDEAVGFHDHPLTLKSYLNRGKMAGKSYALWYVNFPSLKNELEKFGIEHYYGFINTNRPMLFKARQYFKRIIANSVTTPIFLFIGNIIFHLGKNKKFFWFYRQVNEINFRKAFRQRMKELQNCEEEIFGDFAFHPILSIN